MRYSNAITLAALAVGVQSQGAPIGMAPAGGSPPGCITTGDGYYQITVAQLAPTSEKRNVLERRAECGGGGTLVFQLKNGVITDREGRIGSIVANRQFQFDGPTPQTGAIYTGGFSVCQNTSLAIGPTTNFYQCISGSFYNLYDQPSGAGCVPVKFNTIPCTIGSSVSMQGAFSSAASEQSDGQPTASSAAVVFSQQSDGQPTAGPASTVISQQSDGQPTASSAATVISQQSDGQPTASSAATVISQQSDGQPTASSAPVVSQASDGQPQATGSTNGTIVTPSPPVATGAAAAQFIASGAVAAIAAAAALLL